MSGFLSDPKSGRVAQSELGHCMSPHPPDPPPPAFFLRELCSSLSPRWLPASDHHIRQRRSHPCGQRGEQFQVCWKQEPSCQLYTGTLMPHRQETGHVATSDTPGLPWEGRGVDVEPATGRIHRETRVTHGESLGPHPPASSCVLHSAADRPHVPAAATSPTSHVWWRESIPPLACESRCSHLRAPGAPQRHRCR